MAQRKSFKKNEKGPNINENIRSSELRLIDEKGEMIGVISTKDALIAAIEKGLDLVEMDPNSKPPVAKIMDYGKYKYEQKKKKQEAKKKQTNVVLKEVQFRPNIDKHDFDFKMKHVERFINEGNKVKVCVVFRGRQMAHVEIGNELIDRIKELTKEYAVPENDPKLEGRRMIMQLAPVNLKP
jgi:translation initiation factor IF-3